LSCFLFLRQNLSKPTTPQIRNFWMFTSLFTLFHIGKFSVANFSHSQPRRHQVAMALDLTPVPGEFLAGSICVARIYIMCIWRNKYYNIYIYILYIIYILNLYIHISMSISLPLHIHSIQPAWPLVPQCPRTCSLSCVGSLGVCGRYIYSEG
jgi:hypothetical protein